jgi:hypothetical protein
MLCLSALGSVLMDMGLPIRVGEGRGGRRTRPTRRSTPADAQHARKKIARRYLRPTACR